MSQCIHVPADGVRIRPLLDGDRRSVEEVFAGLSARSRFLRFHAGTPRLTERHLRHLSTMRPGVHEACVAEVAGHAVGIARWHRLRETPGTAEVAVAVADRHHGRGVGRGLVAAALQSAGEAGIERIAAEVHPENAVVRRWLNRAGGATGGPWGSVALSLPAVVEMLGVPSETCGCMSRWSTGSSGRSGPAPAPTSHPFAATVLATCSPSSSSGVDMPSRPAPSSTSSGGLRRAS